MSYQSRSLTDWLLLRAWTDPDHPRPLQVVIRRPGRRIGEPGPEQAFADADGAANFVRSWLLNLVRRWEAGERFPQPELWQEDDEPGDSAEGAQ